MSVLETFMHDPLVEWVPSVSKRVSRLISIAC
jgi:phosphatidylinositol kinase/protein kinase (PI-3  family)